MWLHGRAEAKEVIRTMVDALYTIIIEPLVYVIDLVFSLSYKLLHNPGLAIACVSVVVNFLCLPLYRMADAQQEQERQKQRDMQYWVTHIKKHFKGDEQYMMLNTYYRQQGYSQLSQLKGSISLLLQIPIFIAAYNYLSHLELLNGSGFLFIENLGAPDQLLALGSLQVNVLPFVMTALNLVSSVVYTSNLALKDKIQSYGLAVLFLVLLYNSPSGLVLYWTLNQVFSLIKNVVLKTGARGRVALVVLCEALIVGLTIWLQASGRFDVARKAYFVYLLDILLQIPLLAPYIPLKGLSSTAVLARGRHAKAAQGGAGSLTVSYLLVSTLLVLIYGVFILAALIGDAPTEFIDVNNYVNPLAYLIHNTELCIGFFFVWVGVYYYLSDQEGRARIVALLSVLAVISIITYLFFGRDLGIIGNDLRFEEDLSYARREYVGNLLAVAAALGAVIAVWKWKPALLRSATVVCIVAIVAMSVPNILGIIDANRTMLASEQEGEGNEHSAEFYTEEGEPKKLLKLSKEGTNVVVIFIDRAVAGSVPYILAEKPELEERLAGFTYYPNTVSFGAYTIFGSAPLYGGYEYTPVEMNRRDTETLKEKQNESIKVMPTLFANEGYNVTVTDPAMLDFRYRTYDYSTLTDVSDNISCYHTEGAYTSRYLDDVAQDYNEQLKRRFVYYCLFKCAPVPLQGAIYNGGKYLAVTKDGAVELSQDFVDSYSVMDSLSEISEIDEGDSDNFVLMHNHLTHYANQLQLPDYKLTATINNEGLEQGYRDAEGYPRLELNTDLAIAHYHVHMSFFMKLADWCDYLRANDLFDNTRIIVVSDHGHDSQIYFNANLNFDKVEDANNPNILNPLFMVKDFGTHPFEISDEFMTHADTPTLAVDGLMRNPVNPYTGKKLTNKEKFLHPQLLTASHIWNINSKSNGAPYQKASSTTFDTSDQNWWYVSENIFDENNWRKVKDKTVMKHKDDIYAYLAK